LVDGPFAYRYPRGKGKGLPLEGTPEPVVVGRGEKLRDGGDGVIFALGSPCHDALAAAELLGDEGLSLAVVDPRFLKPLDKELLVAEARRTGVVITVEENAVEGGFGSAVLELMNEQGLAPRLLRIGIPDRFVEQGTQAELRSLCGLDVAGLVPRIRSFVQSSARLAQSATS
jgi:1-deoxy-D-xylulose-5-phosphate synthase